MIGKKKERKAKDCVWKESSSRKFRFKMTATAGWRRLEVAKVEFQRLV